jgi:hypothetical protein
MLDTPGHKRFLFFWSRILLVLKSNRAKSPGTFGRGEGGTEEGKEERAAASACGAVGERDGVTAGNALGCCGIDAAIAAYALVRRARDVLASVDGLGCVSAIPPPAALPIEPSRS